MAGTGTRGPFASFDPLVIFCPEVCHLLHLARAAAVIIDSIAATGLTAPERTASHRAAHTADGFV